VNIDLYIIISSISAIGAFLAALAALLAARATRRNVEGLLLKELFSEYASPQMLVSLRRLKDWEVNHGDSFAEKWLVGIKSGIGPAMEVDLARRKLDYFYSIILWLNDSKMLSKKSVRMFGTFSGYNLLFSIVEPLDKIMNPKYNKNTFNRIRRLCGTPSEIDIRL